MNTISICENGLYLVVEITPDLDVRLLHFSVLEFEGARIPERQKAKFRLVEIQASGENQDDHHGCKHTGTVPGKSLKYKAHSDYRNESGRKLEITAERNGLSVTSHLQFYDGIRVARSWTEVSNESDQSVGLEYVSSFSLSGIAKEGALGWDEKTAIHIPHNTWLGEGQWRRYGLPELGLSRLGSFSMKRISIWSNGTWSTSEYLPMGIVTNTECGSSLFWQIENNGAWHWEVSDIEDHLYLKLSGPTQNECHWWKNLAPGGSFASVPAAIGSVRGGFDEAIAELTVYRRAIRRGNDDNERLPVIFNDYMNCLTGDPSTEKELPLIDAAAVAGCEYYVIDAGWYADGDWWRGVGEWLPSEKRFPGGIRKVIDYIRSKGMTPGLWLEIEVMGIESIAKSMPDDWFFVRHGKRAIDHGRYQLDFRNPRVVAYADGIIERLVAGYGIGYIKMDYNINAGIGTELGADSFGDGLLSHNRAYLEWIDGLFEKYPHLVIENCSSGGMRMDYAMLSRHSIQSSSDQTDYLKNAVVSASVLSAVAPEQCAVWSYPLRNGDTEDVAFNMVNSMLCRIHQSGHIAELSAERFAVVVEGIRYYKKIRGRIKEGVPFWPLGIPSFSDSWISAGLNCGNILYLAVWKLERLPDTCTMPLLAVKAKMVTIKCGFPENADCSFEWIDSSSSLRVSFPGEHCARLFEIIPE